ncbi:MAG: VOC family protein [Candidatus Binatia bacterium]
MRFDSVRIQVSDLGQAVGQYELLLGVQTYLLDDGTQRFQLGRGAVELVEGEPGLHSLRFAATDPTEAPWPCASDAFHGLCVRVGPPLDVPALEISDDAANAIDHVVVHSPDLDRALALWRDRLRLRLALDREFPARGLRILFFRSGGITLEFVGMLPQPATAAGPDRLYGVAYQVRDLDAYRARLLRNGVDVGAIRPGHNPGTSVVTVRTGTAGIPTLLLSTRTKPDSHGQ